MTLDTGVSQELAIQEAEQKRQGSSEKKVLIPVVRGQPLQAGIPVVTGAIPARLLALKHKVDFRDALRKTGYQRRPDKSRINKFKTELRKGIVDVPTAILLNIRGGKAVVEKYLRENEQGQLFLELDLADENLVLYVVDGQHRVLALVELCEEDEKKWAEFALQFVMLLGANLQQEMRQFYVVNTNAKSVKTDLALDLLKQQYDADGKVMDQTIREGRTWMVEGQRIVEVLAETSPIWKGRIQLANEPKGDTLIPAASFVNSLKPLMTSSYLGSLNVDQQIRILYAYWTGIRDVCREPFEGKMGSSGDMEFTPSDYTLLKGIGVTAMHELLLVVLEHVRSKGDSVVDPKAYRNVLENILNSLEGDNTRSEIVSGPDFWLTAQHGGAAGSFSSSAGKRVLQAKLRQHLPELEVE